MTDHAVPRFLRLVNILAVGLLAAGAGLYARAWVGMRGLESYEVDPSAQLFAGIAEFNRFWELSRLAMALILAGLAVAAVSSLAAYLVRRTRR